MQCNWWAFAAVADICQQKPKQAWPLIQVLLRVAKTKELIQDLGAGPLEEFIRAHGEQFIERIEDLAAQSDRFRKALRRVWIRGRDDDLTRRLVTLGCQDLNALSKNTQRRSSFTIG